MNQGGKVMTEETFDASLMAAMSLATRLVAARVLSVISLLMAFALAGWAMILQTILSASIAAGFAILVYLPALLGERRKE
jgi:hypothetical protein